MKNKMLSGRRLGREILSSWQIYVMLAPFMLIFLTFTVLPVLMTIGISFTTYNVLEDPVFVGLSNYRRLFVEDDVFAKAVKNTIVFALFSGPLGYMLSFAASWCINEMGPRIKAVLTFVFYIPTISGMAYTVWKMILGSDMYSYLNSFLLSLGLIDTPVQWLNTEAYILPIVIIVQLWMSYGTGFLTMVAGFTTIDNQYYEAGAIDGIRNRFQELRYITLPLMVPHLMTSALLQITSMFANTTAANNLVGFPSTNYAGHLIMTHLNDYANIRVERGYASAIAVVLFILMVSMNKFILTKLKKMGV